MESINSSRHWLSTVAAAADLCMKPWKHSAIAKDLQAVQDFTDKKEFDLIFRIECRSLEGERHPKNDLEIEIFRSGKDLNLTLCLFDQPEQPILWHGRHSIWMDGSSGKRSQSPSGGANLEALARRIRSLIVKSEVI